MLKSHISRALVVHSCGLSCLLLSANYERLLVFLPSSLYHQILIHAGSVLLIGALTLALARNQWVENWSRHIAPWPAGLTWEVLMFLIWIMPVNSLVEFSLDILPYHSRDDTTLRLFSTCITPFEAFSPCLMLEPSSPWHRHQWPAAPPCES